VKKEELLPDFALHRRCRMEIIMKIHNENFNIAQIAESGQCFRMNYMEEGRYNLIAFGKYLELRQVEEDIVELNCSETEYEILWKDYFDLEYDYGYLTDQLMKGKDAFLRSAAEYGKGIRILRQDFFEMMISFILSQNKNIPAIKSSVEALCQRYGSKVEGVSSGKDSFYAFPTPGQLAKATKEELRELRVGYRDEYILQASQAVVNGQINISEIRSYSYADAFQALKQIHGIGEKVANCICLYGLHHIEVFPIDVWIKRILEEVYQNEFDLQLYSGHAGIVQQYMFYYMRNKK
jgi:N-glycosylase/DNA lyase